MIRKVRNCCETCENLVCVATTIGQLQHKEYLKPTFLDTFKWAIRPVFPETVTYHDKLAAELELLQEQHIIAPVTEPIDWCAPIVVTPQKNSDSIRMCVDLSHLNRFVRRERYQSCSPAEAVADMAASNAKFFTVLDARKGYHQCPLDAQSQLLTTFITLFGRFKYLRAPYGISSISEHYDRCMAEAFIGLSGF